MRNSLVLRTFREEMMFVAVAADRERARHRGWPLMMTVLLGALLLFGRPALGADTAALVTIDGAIGPPTAMYVQDAMERAEKMGASIIILRMDTPGGLSVSMRDIIKDVLASPVPVIGFVAPAGARAASAGTYILYATHVAAMAPATNVGAATPVSIGGAMGGGSEQPDEGNKSDKSKDKGENEPSSSGDAERRKILNDSVAFIRSLAERRGRNADWAEKAVRDAASLSADEAVAHNVADLKADSVPALLKAIDGWRVEIGGRTITLHTADLQVVEIQPGWRVQALSVISNPTLAYLLLLAGIFGLAIELFSPGLIFPGVAGGICLLVALFAFQVLPVNFAGLALLAFGLALLIAEALVPSFGVLGFGGIVAFVLGSVMLMDTNIPGYSISIGLIVGISTAAAAALALILSMLWRSRRRPVVTGDEAMQGENVVALEDFSDEGWVRVHGEIWRARTSRPLHKGERARIAAMDGLTLIVEADNGQSTKPPETGEGEA